MAGQLRAMMATVKGIAPSVLVQQIQATAPWGPALAPVTDAAAIEEAWRADAAGAGSLTYLSLLLSAHYLTVATFCPTDVDARIRHHYWMELDPERFDEAVDRVDVVAALDPRPVSARVVGGDDPGGAGPLSGHDGEWFSVRAGALGRALSLDRAAAVARLESAIESELEREASIFQARLKARDMVGTLTAATVLAHNVGDLSRVVEEWPNSPAHAPLRARFAKLGHVSDRNRYDNAFFVAGIVNKRIMAVENHRFLALRKPRALRASRQLLLPIGPFFEGWGQTIARSLEEDDRAEVVAALLETHLRGEGQLGVLRALRGIAETAGGPWARTLQSLPARLRKVAAAGDVPAAMRIPEGQFLARLENRYRAALDEARS